MNNSNLNLMECLLHLQERTNRRAAELSPEIGEIFREISLKKPNFVYAELDFLYLISWLYGYYRDDAKAKFTFEYLADLSVSLNIDKKNRNIKYLELINRLRTYLQHNLSSGENDCKTKFIAEEWFENTDIRGDETNGWELRLERILKETLAFTCMICKCLSSIKIDESRERIVADWLSRRVRVHSDYEFDSIIRDVLFDFGQESKDVVSFRKRYIESWRRCIKGKNYRYDFESEARKLVEEALEKDGDVPPIDGKDIMNALGIEAGPTVKVWRDRAAAIWREKKCRPEIVLDFIKREYLESTLKS